MNDKLFLPIYLAGSILLVIIVFFIILYIVIYSRRQHRNRMEKTQLIHEYEKNLLTARLDEGERAMAQLSKELHDNVAQKVDFVQMSMKALDDAPHPEQQARLQKNSLALLAQVTNDIRNISYALNGEYIRERGLGDVLAHDIAYLRDSQSINCELQMDGVYRTLPPEKELLIYRIAQAGLHNAAKHAKAESIRVTLRYSPAVFTMCIADDGVGFDRASDHFTAGLGMRNMQQRAELLDANLSIESAPGKGCTLLLTMPKPASISLN